MLEKINYYKLFKDYPEIITVKEMRKMLGGITKYAAFKLINEEKVQCKKVARVCRISKNSVIQYLISKENRKEL